MQPEKLLEEIKKNYLPRIEKVTSLQDLEKVRVEILGKKGILTSILRGLKDLPLEERKHIGREANLLKEKITSLIEKKKEDLKSKKEISQFDPTLPSFPIAYGKLHPLTQVMEEIIEIFKNLGFQVFTGPEIETDYYNFEALNFPPDHPARDVQDSFRFEGDWLLRTQTSPVQIRVMERFSPPIRIVSPGRCFRRDNPDASHLPMFHQIEGLAVDENITFSDLKGVLEEFAHAFFGEDVKMRFVPSFFPFTEPSAEVSISCIICKGKGCKTCGYTGWLEILGAGMVHPQVFRNVGYDPEKYTGFAFGMGVERIAMLKYRVNDIRLFYENDFRFLQQL
ncbi:MAG TPA: phenylalanine--tRNA ligase subunit alpha [bacterium]|nr:phenylalanine--tRNA ligase subunit alpha [bacterium]HEX68275.1 phenylalanine--tRNA ligase subunit alpha [bacterium]